MKHLLGGFVFLFLAACGSNNRSDENRRAPDLDFTLDTVQIDIYGNRDKRSFIKRPSKTVGFPGKRRPAFLKK